MFPPSFLAFFPRFTCPARTLSDLSIRRCFLISRGSRFPIPRVEILRILENSRDAFYIEAKDTPDKVATRRTVALNKTLLFCAWCSNRRLEYESKSTFSGTCALRLHTDRTDRDVFKITIIAIAHCDYFVMSSNGFLRKDRF